VCFAHGKHTPPEPADVPALMAEFYQELARHWDTRSPVENAAFAMWKINWIHPFRNGNGRTSRAFSYACLCLRAGIWLPGRPTVLEVLNNDPAAHARYAALLQLTDRTFEAGKLDLKPLADFLEELTIRQLSSIEEVAGIEVSEPASPPV
jgi:Fic family protein